MATIADLNSSLMNLGKLVAKFYNNDEELIICTLLKYIFISEDNLAKLLCFDNAQIRALYHSLSKDHFVQMRIKQEMNAYGEEDNVTYYYINFKLLIHVMKYKLNMININMETEQSAANNIYFECSVCYSIFSDSEAQRLLTKNLTEFLCLHCKSPVSERHGCIGFQRKLTHFNEQLQSLNDLLQQLKDVVLPAEFIDPEAKTNATKANKYVAQYCNAGGTGTAETVEMPLPDMNDMQNIATTSTYPMWLPNSADDTDSCSELLNTVQPPRKKIKLDNVDTKDNIMAMLLLNEH